MISYDQKLPFYTLFLIVLYLPFTSHAEVYFESGFESGLIETDPSPRWALRPAMSQDRLSSIAEDTMFGPNDIYSITDDMAHSGSKSWRLNFGGRNGWCNVCGSSTINLSGQDIAAGCISISKSPIGSLVFNKSNGFSVWEVASQTNNTACIRFGSSAGESLFDAAQVNEGDEFKLPNKCGVNGTVGGSTTRRSDCNKAINYFLGTVETDFEYGEDLSRRFYMYIPSDTVLPDITLKLGYTHFKKDGPTYSSTLKISVQRGMNLELSTPKGPVVLKETVPKDEWVYFEEVFTRESSSGASDGRYRLWVSPADAYSPEPIRDEQGLEIGKLIDMSFNGNFQHYTDSSGYVYFDDLKIGNEYAGPVLSKARADHPPQQTIKATVIK